MLCSIDVSSKIIPDECQGSDEWMRREIDDLVKMYEKNPQLHHIHTYRDLPGKEKSKEYYMEQIIHQLTNSKEPGGKSYYMPIL